MNSPLKLIESFGNRFVKEYIEPLKNKRSEFRSDWFEALDFFLARAYYQGRKDELSERYCKAAKKTLLSYFGEDSSTRLKNYNNAWNDKIIPHDPEWKIWKKDNNGLLTELERVKAGKSRDIKMVIDILRFVHSCPSNNIVLYSIEEIEHGRIKKLYSEIDEIWQVGPKVTSLYLRDLIFCYDLKLTPEDYPTIQPIDTWVNQVASGIGICSDKDPKDTIIAKFIEACAREKVDPKKVNAGAWYLGANAFDILLDNILNGKDII